MLGEAERAGEDVARTVQRLRIIEEDDSAIKAIEDKQAELRKLEQEIAGRLKAEY